MKKKLINLTTVDITKESIPAIEYVLDVVDISDYGEERISAFEEMMEVFKNLVEIIDEECDISGRYHDFKKEVDEVLSNAATTREELLDLYEILEQCIEEAKEAIPEVEDDPEKQVEEFIDKLTDYQIEYGGLGNLYVELP